MTFDSRSSKGTYPERPSKKTNADRLCDSQSSEFLKSIFIKYYIISLSHAAWGRLASVVGSIVFGKRFVHNLNWCLRTVNCRSQKKLFCEVFPLCLFQKLDFRWSNLTIFWQMLLEKLPTNLLSALIALAQVCYTDILKQTRNFSILNCLRIRDLCSCEWMMLGNVFALCIKSEGLMITLLWKLEKLWETKKEKLSQSSYTRNVITRILTPSFHQHLRFNNIIVFTV